MNQAAADDDGESIERASVEPTEQAEARRRRIAEAAYMRAAARNFEPGDPTEDWLVAEREIDAAMRAAAGELRRIDVQDRVSVELSLRERLGTIDAGLAALREDAKALRGSAKQELERVMTTLGQQRHAAEGHLTELRDASQAAWAELRQGAERAWHELAHGIETARSRRARPPK